MNWHSFIVSCLLCISFTAPILFTAYVVFTENARSTMAGLLFGITVVIMTLSFAAALGLIVHEALDEKTRPPTEFTIDEGTV